MADTNASLGNSSNGNSSDVPVLNPEAVMPEEEAPSESVQHPAKVMRIGSMIKQLLEEVRRAPLDDAGRERLAAIYATSIEELSSSLSDDLQDELRRLASPLAGSEGPPSEAELRIAQAQLVGWLEGLFHGIQATLFAQQMEARQQLDELRRRSLPAASEEVGNRPGTYL
jgi:hypothetical protein